MPTSRTGAVLLAGVLMCIHALLFWTLMRPTGDSALSFWNNRTVAERFVLTALYVCFSARILLWYHDRMRLYAAVRGRGTLRLLPLAFGVAVVGSTMAWWLAVVFGVPAIELYSALFQHARIEWTVALLPFSYFIQLLFLSRTTIFWLLAAGLSWPLVTTLAPTKRVLSAFYQQPAGDRATPPLGWLKVWNVFGYLVFLLSLLFQSG